MKLFLKLLLIAVILVSPFSAVNAEANNIEVSVKVKGLVCDFCAVTLKKTFQKEEAVSDIEVNLTEKYISIDLKEGFDLDDDKIIKYVRDAGYDISEINRS